jgi:hypothetical protein
VGNILTFVHSRFSEQDLGERIHSVLDGIRRIDAQPMALRSIFIAVASEAQNEATRRES